MASENGHEKIVRQLLQSGARDIPNKVGRIECPRFSNVYTLRHV